jgi:dihydroorotate dehydrogenase electron transfer subunit
MTSTRAPRVTAPFGARVASITGSSRHGAYVVLECLDVEGPRPQPGQFYMLAASRRWGGGVGERPYLPRAFSVLRVSSPPDAERGVALQFLVEDVGPGTNRLCELGAGDGLSLVGPLGNGFAPPRDGRRALLVGGGVGIAPLAIWHDELGPRATVLLGFRDGDHAAGAQLFPNARVATDDGSSGHHGLVTELLDDELDDNSHAQVYACGPPAMLEAVRLLCTVREIPAQLALESGMACGFGACFGCVVETRSGYVRVCLDGPVLEAAELGPEAFAGIGMGH